MIEHPENIGVVQPASTLLPTRHLPNKTRRINNRPVHNRTGDIPKQPNRKLYQPQGHRLVPRIDTPQYQQHAPHLRGRMNKNKYGKEDNVPGEIRALQIAVAYFGHAKEGAAAANATTAQAHGSGVVRQSVLRLGGNAQTIREFDNLAVDDC